MKKQFSILTIGAMIVGLAISSFGTALISDAAPANDKNQNSRKETQKPAHATNIKIAKKIPVSLAVKEAKDFDTKNSDISLEQDFSERVATGILDADITGNKYAVVIGICDYPGRRNDICSSDGDSYNMRKALIENYGYSPENIYWFRDKGGTIDRTNYGKPTHENIRNAVMDIKYNKGLNANDEVVFFFSGHGVSGTVIDGTKESEDDGEDVDEGMVVYDSDRRIDGDGYSKLDFIWDGELRSWFYGFGTERIIFMFDTCLAGGMNDVAYDEYDEIYSDRVVVMSSKETQSSYVYSYGKLGEGMFSRYFVHEGMLQGLADGYNQISEEDDLVVVEEAFDYAKEIFPSYLEFRQNPVISDEFENDLIL